ncbi:AEL240Cp [Eremothecium gossypii ATCC 10895]|uniref:AEL240Cp n=1 Tax=Eremothecium gossypii (strain ATCC 10895 / CBS 109.51 / FGSC 9923 / NRRL Y-1056) TaxID=284811 RepID=Q758K2_EREGS|nr:AEL240Cp [Eremothecium gossypii ATCC 10895]AAS52445.1 AEL240Cp [Eremothecium gossypii ATCC 10895]AEY96744.1 FAEL240Cp [Eremothecium gossypii FDAG1]
MGAAQAGGAFKMKRPAVDPAGIATYKRQRLVADLENLRISEVPAARAAVVDSAGRGHGNALLADRIRDQVWEVLQRPRGEAALQQRMCRQIWQDTYNSHMQVVRWVDWPARMFQIWLRWWQSQGTESSDVEMATDYESYEEEETPMDVDEDGDWKY